jgi:hypothetical protein
MARIKATQFPTVARSGRVSKYATEMAELEALLKEPNFGADGALMFEVTKDDMPQLVSSLRKEAKNVGRKVQCVFKEQDDIPVLDADDEPTEDDDGNAITRKANVLYVKDNGALDAESASATTIRAGQAAKPAAKK